jgi:hypothetical protein
MISTCSRCVNSATQLLGEVAPSNTSQTRSCKATDRRRSRSTSDNWRPPRDWHRTASADGVSISGTMIRDGRCRSRFGSESN